MVEPRKIAMIGPVYPYKGGIAHYTGLLCRALSKKYHVSMISFSLQYPRFLYRKEQKDCGNDTFQIKEARFGLNTLNPFSWAATAWHIRKQAPDLIIFQWWHPYFAPCYYGIQKLLRGHKTLFVCHNVFPHERFPLDRFLAKVVLKAGDFHIVHSRQDENDLKSLKNDPRHIRATHPTYGVFRMTGMTKDAARRQMNLPPAGKIMLFFGFVRDYKGLDILIDALTISKKEIPDIKLLIAGDFAADKTAYMEQIKANGAQENVDIHEGYIPDREVEKFFACCDVVVLPYKSATQSGIAQIAYGFGKPVIVTDVGGLPEIVQEGKTGYVVRAGDAGELAAAIARFFENRDGIDFAANIRKESYKYTWDRLVECIEGLLT